jgi:hypothetical protein
MTRFARSLQLLALLFALASALPAAGLPCAPCAGFAVDDPFALLPAAASAPALADDALAVVAYDLELDGAATPAAAHALAARRLSPWMRLVFRTPSPLFERLADLQAELDAAAAAVVRSSPAGARYQIVWRPEPAAETAPSAAEYAFLVKRASVAVTGEDPDAAVVSQPLPADPAWIAELYTHEVAAYFDALALAPDGDLAPAVARLRELDAGKPLVLDGAPLPAPARLLLAEAAAAKEAGFDLVLFRSAAAELGDEHFAALALVANEFRGELSLDPGTRPAGAERAWSFVRGEDLALRVVAVPAADSDELRLRFPDAQLRSPAALLGAAAEVVPLSGFRRTADGVEVLLADPEPAVVLRLERASIAELEGVEEEVTVADERRIPVEEILRRLQAFEDAQNRRVRHWQAVNSTTLRFQAASGLQAVEATFRGEAFFRPGQPFDWAWQSFYLNGVEWKGKRIPEIPLIQPEKAAALPLEILFTKEYRYELRGTESVRGRDCWRIGFEPAVAAEPGRTLFRGTVWVDRATSARVRTRAEQLGLTGEVISNEETIDYSPIDSAGAPAEWGPHAYVLPLRTVGQQLLSVLNSATVVEREVALTEVIVNGDGFDARREQVLASAATMVRDTEAGLRYLVPVEGGAPGERVVKEGFDTSKLFLLGGVFYDDSLDYPLPLAGINYFDLNFRGGERQLNAFFGGVLGIVNYADPHLFGSKLDLGADLFAIAVASTDELFRDERHAPGEDVEELPARVTFNLGFPLGSFFKVNTSYRLAYSKFSRADDTAADFVLPSDHLRHELELGLQYARGGYRLDFESAYHARDEWERWGLPDAEFDPDTDTYVTWQLSAAKNWYLSGFRKIGAEIAYVDGDRLDRFSKYQFGFFGATRVHGYQIGKVRAEKAYLAHATYGFEIGQLLRLDGIVDAAWATDRESGLDSELLAGVGVAGTFQGPWETLIQIDVGTPVAGPDDGIVAYLVFLKLFD